jgi:hypothetical protein
MKPLLLLWSTAVMVAATGTWILFDGAWGVNTVVWTATVCASLLLCARSAGGRDASRLAIPIGLAMLLAGGTAVTTNGALHGWTVVALMFFLAIATLIAADGPGAHIGALFMARAPLAAAGRGLAEFVRRVNELTERLSADRARPWVRGALLASPILVLFALLLADADPIFATARRSLRETLEAWDFLPRAAFFATSMVAALGAGGLALRGSSAAVRLTTSPTKAAQHIGPTERAIVLGGVAVLFAVFLLLQLSYLFGNAPAVTGSGVTFAEYARRGFNELTIVASLCALLVIALDGAVDRGGPARLARLIAILVVAETLLLLVSAFRRVWLYEAAYGFTTTRLYAQTYMVVVASMLTMLGWEIQRGLDAHRLARRTATLAALAFAALVYWNHEAWIVRVNVARAAQTGSLDAAYLVNGLSLDAVPALVDAQASAPEPVALALRQALQARHAATAARPCRWFEANIRHVRATAALASAGLGTDTRPGWGGCVRLGARP